MRGPLGQPIREARLWALALRLAHEEGRRLRIGYPGQWEVDIALSGLSEERIRSLIARGPKSSTPYDERDDGCLHCLAMARDSSLLAASLASLLVHHDHLRRAGLGVEEARAADTTLKVTPLPDPIGTQVRPGRREVIGYALESAGFKLLDAGIISRLGSGTWAVTGSLDGLDASDARAMGWGAEPSLKARIVEEGSLAFDILATGVGTPISALHLALQELAPTLREATPRASLTLTASASRS
jgi:hypothetical protein